MQKTRTKVGILGAGYIMNLHVNALRAVPSVDLSAVCDISKPRAERAARQYAIPNVYTSIQDLLQSPVDTVHILLPPDLHEDAAEAALLAGKNVLLEKPMGLSPKRCFRLVSLANEKGETLAVSHNFLFCPAYEILRKAVKQGELGRLDRITVNWLNPLGFIQLGPYNNWMLRSPQNLLFETAPHPLAFIVDLLGRPDDISCQAADPIDLPGHQLVYRQWTLIGTKGRTVFTVNISHNPGQSDRSVHIRGSSAVGRLDYERNLGWIERVGSKSVIFDGLRHGRSISKTLASQTRANFKKYVGSSIRKSVDNNAYQESIHRSISAFYETRDGGLDPRLDGALGAEITGLCERSFERSGIAVAPKPSSSDIQLPPNRKADTLVLGGSGFIGKNLVSRLLEDGRRVRVLTRSRRTAEMALESFPVDIVEGRHDDSALLDGALSGIRTVYHLAKAVGEKWSDYLENDVEPTKVFARSCLEHGVERFIYTGTIDSYKTSDPSAVITGETQLDPGIRKRNLYARSKAICEEILLALYREKGLPLVILRPGIVIGKGSPPAHWGVGMFLSDSQVKFWGDGDNALPFVLVEDVAQALVLAGNRQGIEGRTFLLTDKPMLSAREYIGCVEKYTGIKFFQVNTPIWKYFLADLFKEIVKNSIRHPNRRCPSYSDWACRAHRSTYDSSLTIRDLGWKPAGNKADLIERGIKAAVDYYYR